MRVAIGKIGQKLIFDRTSADGLRSNNNGNLDAYMFYQMLFDLFPENEYYCFGDNDNSFNNNRVHDCSDHKNSTNEFDGIGIFYCGLQELDTGLIGFIERTKIPYYLFTTDSRCIPKKINNRPKKIFSMATSKVYIQGDSSFYCEDVIYSPIAEILAYHRGISSTCKYLDVLISVSDSEDYNRVDKILEVIGDDLVPIYGRNKRYMNDPRFRGEIEYAKIDEKYKAAKITILSPIEKGWTTSKYVECLANNVVPLFTSDYGLDYLDFNPVLKELLVVDSHEKYENIKKLLLTNEWLRESIVHQLRCELDYAGMTTGYHISKFIREEIFRNENENVLRF